MSAWAVANTLPHQEARAEDNLRRQGFHAWLPSILRSRRHARRIDTVRAPMFPGYLFVRLDPAGEHWKRINGTFGVRRLLTQGEKPQLLPEPFVSELRASMGEDGVCRLAGPDLDAGTRVRVMTGPFADCLATVTALAPGDRVRLLLSVLGGEVAVTMARAGIIRAA